MHSFLYDIDAEAHTQGPGLCTLSIRLGSCYHGQGFTSVALLMQHVYLLFGPGLRINNWVAKYVFCFSELNLGGFLLIYQRKCTTYNKWM